MFPRVARCGALGAGFAVLHGKVQYVEVHLIGGPDPGVYGGYIEEINPRSTNGYSAYSFRTPIGKPYLRVSLTPQAPAALRDRAFSLNMHCIMAIRGCDKPCDYLPELWVDWKADLAASGWSEDLKISYPRCP